jgi:hypothetical protein
MEVALKVFLCTVLVGLSNSDSPPFVLIDTLIQEPFVMKASNGKDKDAKYGYKGILIDLLGSFFENNTSNAVPKLQVQMGPGSKDKNGKWSGLIGDMVDNSNVVFGLADITINSERMDVVRFSLPYFSTGLSAVGKGIDFPINQDNLQKILDMAKNDKITIGTTKGFASERFFGNNSLPIYKKLNEQMKKSDDNFVKTVEEGIAKVRNASTDKPFIYFEEMAYLDYHAGKAPCDLNVYACETLNSVHYALVFNKKQNKDTITHYNKKIADYLASGKMQLSIKKWYNKECHGNKTIEETERW